MGGKLISRIGLLVFLGGLLLGCADNPEERATKRGEEILFEENQHDYGEIAKNSDGTWSFIFKKSLAMIISEFCSITSKAIKSWINFWIFLELSFMLAPSKTMPR